MIADVVVNPGGRTVVDRVSLEASPGSIVGLVGPNGSGKSTLLRCVYRALKPDSGRVVVNGADVWCIGPRAADQS